MKEFKNKIICGDNMEVMAGLPDNSIDTVITDPPYGLGFMGKDWDTFDQDFATKEAKERCHAHPERQGRSMYAGLYDYSKNPEYQHWFTLWAKEVLRIAKPGAMMLVFGGTRTYHRLTCAIEDAGWQIRDCMMWLYGSGFPKSLDISKAIDKAKGVKGKYGDFKTKDHAIKRKPGNLRMHKGYQRPWRNDPEIEDRNSRQYIPAKDLARFWGGHGTALKPAWEPIILAMKPLDGTFAQNAEKWGVAGLWIDGGRIGLNGDYKSKPNGRPSLTGLGDNYEPSEANKPDSQGRWPANVILDEQSAAMLDEQSGASRFFYCAKASRSERNAGLEGAEATLFSEEEKGMEEKRTSIEYRPGDDGTDGIQSRLHGATTKGQNNHPTVKPLALMEYLCKLTRTPASGIVLDPFGGSGTTALACINTGRNYLLIEKEPQYCKIAEARAGQKALFE